MQLTAVKLLGDSVLLEFRLKQVIQQSKPAQRLEGERDQCPLVSSTSTPALRTAAPVAAT